MGILKYKILDHKVHLIAYKGWKEKKETKRQIILDV